MNGNIQSSLQQFQISHKNSRNTIGTSASRSIDITKTFLSPKSASFALKNPSISLYQHQKKASTKTQESRKGTDELQKDMIMISKFEMPENKSEEVKKIVVFHFNQSLKRI